MHSLLFQHSLVLGTANHQIKRLNGICTCNAALYQKCVSKIPSLGKSEARPCAWEHKAYVEYMSSGLSVLRARLPSPSSRTGRVGSECEQSLAKKRKILLPFHVAKKSLKTQSMHVCLDLLIPLVQLLKDLKPGQITCSNWSHYELEETCSTSAWWQQVGTGRLKQKLQQWLFMGLVHFQQQNRVDYWGQLNLPGFICQNPKLT